MSFEEILAGGFAGICQMVENLTDENHGLEFKQKNNPREIELHKDDRQNFGAALSGFANATGGVLIIGIKTEKFDGVDRAVKVMPIENVDRVADRYRSYASEYVAPEILGIKIATLSEEGGAGVIVISIPKGQQRPHMSMAQGHHRYYRRVSDSFLPMEHYEIEEMMRSRTSPRLRLMLKMTQGGSIGDNPISHLDFGLRNVSRATAKFPYLTIRSPAEGPRVARFGLDGNGNTLWKPLTPGAGDGVTFAAGVDMVIHPNQAFFVSRFEMIGKKQDRFEHYWPISSLVDGSTLDLHFQFGCEDMPNESIVVKFSMDDLSNHRISEVFI